MQTQINTKLNTFINVKNLDYFYSSSENKIKVLDSINLNIKSTEFIAILGSSGSGKSTLMNILGGLEKPKAGQVIINNQDIATFNNPQLEIYRQQQVSFIFQFFNLLPTLTALENVLLAMQAKNNKINDIEKAKHFLSQVGLSDKMHRLPAQLSGGEQQRVAIARAISKETPLILADEPTGNLDEKTAEKIINLLVEIQKKNLSTLILITHDENIALRANKIIRLKQGKLEIE